MKKVLRLTAIILLSVLIFASCAENDYGDIPFIPFDTESDFEPENEYRIVLPELASSTLTDKAEELCALLEEQIGDDVELIEAHEYTRRGEGEWDIFIGSVDIAEVRAALFDLRSNDYICRSYDGYTIIGGRNDAATVAAIERFYTDILTLSDAYCIIPDGGGFEYIADYDTERLSICSADISSFEIVYDSNDDGALQLASELRIAISEYFGYWLEISPDIARYSERDIYIDADLSECVKGRAEILFSGEDITLRAADSVGVEIAADRFFELLCADGSEGILTLEIPERLYIPYGDTECRIASMLLDRILPFDAPAELGYVNSVLNEHSPNAFLCGDISDDDRALLSDTLADYGAVTTDGSAMFAVPDTDVLRTLSRVSDDLSVKVFTVKSGELEFILLYIRGSVSDAISLDVSEVVGSTPYPVVAIVHTKNSAAVVVTNGESDYFERVAERTTSYYDDSFSLSCYTDASRLLVTVGGESARFEYGHIDISVQK